MSTTNQLTGGEFQDILGNPLVDGFLLMELSEDVTIDTSIAVGRGVTIMIPLDSNGDVETSPPQSVWPNDVMTPSDSFYMVSVYSESGQLVWGPNAQQVLSTPSPFDVTAWNPGLVVFS